MHGGKPGDVMRKVIFGGRRGGKMAELMRLLIEALKQGKTTMMRTASYIRFEDKERYLDGDNVGDCKS